MKIFVSQIYIESGVSYPFSHHFQIWLGEELTKRVQPSSAFVRNYSAEFDLIFRMSAKSIITRPEIKGPTVFKREKDVEFTIFLPYERTETNRPAEYGKPLKQFLESVCVVLEHLGMDTSQVTADSAGLVEHIISEPTMITHRKLVS